MIDFYDNSLRSASKPTFNSAQRWIPLIQFLLSHVWRGTLCINRKKKHTVHSRKSPPETRTPTLSKIPGSVIEKRKKKKKKEKTVSTGIFFCLLQLNEDNLTQKWLCTQARKCEIGAPLGRRFRNRQWKVIFCWNANSFRGFVPEACRVKLAFKHIGILMCRGASTFIPLRISMALFCNWLVVHNGNAYICIRWN